MDKATAGTLLLNSASRHRGSFENYLTSTGETVARPGIPQSSGETRFDRYIEQQNDRIDNSICKGC